MTTDRARGALLGTFAGDALGMPFEGAPPERIPERVEMEAARLGRGTYTDDTQMTIALAESLLEHGTVDEDALALAFLDAFDPARGYGGGTIEVLQMWRAGVPVRAAAARVFGGHGSFGNGAAMRIAPVAVRFADHRRRLAAEAARSARLTHAHELGVDAALVQAAAVASAYRGDDVLAAAARAARTRELRSSLSEVERLLARTPEPGEVARRLGNSSAGHESVPAAVFAALAHERPGEAISFAVRCGGDTDTIAAMAGAIAGARDGAGAIPRHWLDALEDGPKGRPHVERLADRLARS